MAAPTKVDPILADAVSQVNVEVIGSVPSVTAGIVQQVLGDSIALSMQVATQSQQQLSTIAQTVVAKAVSRFIASASSSSSSSSAASSSATAAKSTASSGATTA